MRVFQLEPNPQLYSSNVFLVLGDWSRLDDVNTLIDAGASPAVLDFVGASPTGVGKQGVDQVILTHHHSDHTLMAPAIVQRFGARVYAWGGSGEDDAIYFGHGPALVSGCRDRLATALRHVRQSRRRIHHPSESTFECLSAAAEQE